MSKAGINALRRQFGLYEAVFEADALNCFRAMLEAAPKPATESSGECSIENDGYVKPATKEGAPEYEAVRAASDLAAEANKGVLTRVIKATARMRSTPPDADVKAPASGDVEKEILNWIADEGQYIPPEHDTAPSPVEKLREALEEIANHPHCEYPHNAPYVGDYQSGVRVGIADGHRCAAKIARSALAATERSG
jgi:hypothetical protein